MRTAEKIARLRLIRTPYIGPATYDHLIQESGSAEDALNRVINGDIRSQRTLTPPSERSILQELKAIEKLGGNMIFREEETYPKLLRQAPLAPIAISTIGNTELFEKELIAIVGARNASHAGLRIAGKLAAELSGLGYGIVSGLARGIDASAHRESLAGGTIAVLAGGIDQIYPPQNAELYHQIPQTGLLLSEMPLGTEPQARLFPRRNRVIAGLCRICIVVEASLKSGSQITASLAADYGREVAAVPGSPLDSRNLGSLRLLKDGAHVITSAEDVIDILSGLDSKVMKEPAIVHRAPPLAPDPDQIQRIKDWIQEYIGVTACPIADLILDIPEPENVVLAALAELELDGLIERHWDNQISAL